MWWVIKWVKEEFKPLRMEEMISSSVMGLLAAPS
jgi:hypothetical protein